MIDGDQLYAGTVADYQVRRTLLLTLVMSLVFGHTHALKILKKRGYLRCQNEVLSVRERLVLPCTFFVWNFLTINSKSSRKAADPHHRYADLDPSFTLMRIGDPGLTFHSDADLDPDPAPHHLSDSNLWPLAYRPSSALFKPPCLHCKRPRPSVAPFRAFPAHEFWFWCVVGFLKNMIFMQIKIPYPQPTVHRCDFI